MNELITLKTVPEIYQTLEAIKGDLEAKSQEALSLVCTEDTVKEIKKVRTDIRKTKGDLDSQWKAMEKEYMKPLADCKLVYKEATQSIDFADKELKSRIDSVTDELARARDEKLKSFFEEKKEELCISWVKWEQIACKPIASKSDKYYRELMATSLENVVKDISAIEELPNKDLVNSFYSKTLNLAQAMAQATEQEKSILQAKEQMGQAMVQMQQDTAMEEINQTILEPMVEPIQEPEIIAPMEEQPLYTVNFSVKNATMGQLKALKQYLIEGGYEYE
ncbi:MAG: DUF1351 domain-containing protein [Eubacteriales bacterium]